MSQSDYTSYRAYSSRIHQIILNNLKLMGTELVKRVKDKYRLKFIMLQFDDVRTTLSELSALHV